MSTSPPLDRRPPLPPPSPAPAPGPSSSQHRPSATAPPVRPGRPSDPASPLSTSSPAGSIATWKRETSATSCASTRRPSFRRSATNDLIGNFKKPPRLRGTPAWHYKERAIDRLAAELAAALDPNWLSIATLVPIPPSRARSDPDHDDRLLRLLHRLADHLAARPATAPGPPHPSGLDRPTPNHPHPGAGLGPLAAPCHDTCPSASAPHPAGLDIRELLLQRRSTSPVHAAPGRPSPAALASLYEIDETLTSPPPRALGLFDDVLTTGAHFKAAQQVLLQRFPGTPIAGIFLARTPPPWFPPL